MKILLRKFQNFCKLNNLLEWRRNKNRHTYQCPRKKWKKIFKLHGLFYPRENHTKENKTFK